MDQLLVGRLTRRQVGHADEAAQGHDQDDGRGPPGPERQRRRRCRVRSAARCSPVTRLTVRCVKVGDGSARGR